VAKEFYKSLNHSKFGIASVVCASLGASGILLVFVDLLLRPSPSRNDALSWAFALLALCSCFLSLVSFVGLVLGIIGLFQKEKRRLLATVGTGINGFVVILATVLVIVITSSQHH